MFFYILTHILLSSVVTGPWMMFSIFLPTFYSRLLLRVLEWYFLYSYPHFTDVVCRFSLFTTSVIIHQYVVWIKIKDWYINSSAKVMHISDGICKFLSWPTFYCGLLLRVLECCFLYSYPHFTVVCCYGSLNDVFYFLTHILLSSVVTGPWMMFLYSYPHFTVVCCYGFLNDFIFLPTFYCGLLLLVIEWCFCYILTHILL